MSYTSFIIDDEPICIENLKQSLSNIDEIELIGTSNTPKDGAEMILKQHPDLLFLDVEMPYISGLDLLRDMQEMINWPMHVVFYTAYDKYLLDALRVSAFDFLLKPYESEEFYTVINRFLHHAKHNHTMPAFKDSLHQLLPPKTTFMVSTITGFQLLRIEQIGYFEFQNNRKIWEVVLVDGRHLLLKHGTKAEHILNYNHLFVQINKQQIINIDYLLGIQNSKCVLMPPFDQDTALNISRLYLKHLQEKLDLI